MNTDGMSDRVYVSKCYDEEYYSKFHGKIAYIDVKDNFLDRDEAIYLINKLKEVFSIKDDEL